MNTDLKIRLANINLYADKIGYAGVKKWPNGMMSTASLLGSALKRPAHVNAENAKNILDILKSGISIPEPMAQQIKKVFNCAVTDWNTAAILAFRHPRKISQTLPRVGKAATALYAELAHHVDMTHHRTAKTELERPVHFADLLAKRLERDKKPAPTTKKRPAKKTA